MFLHQTDVIEKLEKDIKDNLVQIKERESANAGKEIILGGENERIQGPIKHTKYKSGARMPLFLVKYSIQDIVNSLMHLSKANLGPNSTHYEKL